jgi:DNA-binding Lrp family transcriptional regulator
MGIAPSSRSSARNHRSSRSGGAPGEPSESLDFAILRSWMDEGSALIGFDPRNSPERVARRLRVGPATVRRRLKLWRSRGFLRGFDVIPNPALLGGRLAARHLEFGSSIAQEAAVGPLSLIDGIVQIEPARKTLLAVYFVESGSQGERRRKQLQGIEGVREVGPEWSFEFPACSRRMSRADWRLVLALRRNPEAKLAELAAETGQSTRTTSRRYDSLLADGAVIFDPVWDFSRFLQTLAVLTASVDRPELQDRTLQEIRALHPASIRSWSLQLTEPRGESSTLYLLVTAPTSAELDLLTARVAHLPGVSQVALWYGHSTLLVPSWLTERIESALWAASAVRNTAR